MIRLTLVSIILSIMLPLSGAAFDQNGIEDRCTALGSNCYCSEPLNANDPDSALKTGYNPSDTKSASTFECTDRGGFLELADMVQTQLNAVSLATYGGGQLGRALPAGHQLSTVIRDSVAESSGDGVFWATINGHQPPASAARVCARYYYTVDKFYGGTGQTPYGRNKMMEMSNDNNYMQVQETNCFGNDQSGPNGAKGRPFCEMVMTIGTGPAEGNYAFKDAGGNHTYDDCSWQGGRGSCSGDSNYKCYNTSECSAVGKGTCQNIPPASWCSLEVCTVCPGGNMSAGGNCHYEGFHKILAQNREAKVTTPSAPMTGFGRMGSVANNFFGGDWNHASGVGDVFRNMWMVASWPSDSGQRIGAAKEVESGSGTPTPPATPPSAPVLLP